MLIKKRFAAQAYISSQLLAVVIEAALRMPFKFLQTFSMGSAEGKRLDRALFKVQVIRQQKGLELQYVIPLALIESPGLSK